MKQYLKSLFRFIFIAMTILYYSYCREALVQIKLQQYLKLIIILNSDDNVPDYASEDEGSY